MSVRTQLKNLNGSQKRVALYARVSTEEQTKKKYPSCDSQIEELEAVCRQNGWTVQRVIKDEGFSAGSLKRPGLTELRWLVQSNEIDVVLCTWYDRLTRSREFYILDGEFAKHGVEFKTVHDPLDNTNASGRFMESMLVAAKIRPKGTRSASRQVKRSPASAACEPKKGCGTVARFRTVFGATPTLGQ